MKTNLVLLALCCAVLALAGGCAAPGAPLPPSLRLPQVPDNLSAVRKGSRVVLTWSPPTETTDHQPMRWPSSTRICRVANQFPIARCSEVAAQINNSELASSAPSARRPVVSYEDVLPASLIAGQSAAAQSEATYAIEVVNQRGLSAGLSNQVPIPLVATEPSPAAFRATLDAQGPLLQWEMPSGITASSASASQGISCQIRIYRRSLTNAQDKSLNASQNKSPVSYEFVPVAEQPCHPGAGEARDPSFEWEREYDYKAAAVTVLAIPGQPAAEVEGDDSSMAHLLTHDIFPPAVPRGLQAVFSSVGQKPFIDLAWEPNTESDLAGYFVYRSSAGTAFVVVTPAPVEAPAWRDNDVRPGEKYLYKVIAVDVRGNQSAQSEPASESVPQELAP